jgi:hypothetical protein
MTACLLRNPARPNRPRWRAVLPTRRGDVAARVHSLPLPRRDGKTHWHGHDAPALGYLAAEPFDNSIRPPVEGR